MLFARLKSEVRVLKGPPDSIAHSLSEGQVPGRPVGGRKADKRSR